MVKPQAFINFFNLFCNKRVFIIFLFFYFFISIFFFFSFKKIKNNQLHNDCHGNVLLNPNERQCFAAIFQRYSPSWRPAFRTSCAICVPSNLSTENGECCCKAHRVSPTTIHVNVCFVLLQFVLF